MKRSAFALFCVGVVSWFLVPFAVRKMGERRLAAACARDGLLVLTYDDGPGTSEMMSRLLEVLSDFQARASFFTLGREAVARPEQVRLAVAAGHEVGSHSEQHRNAWKSDPVRTTLDVAAGVRIVDGLGGTGRLVRPPFGKVTLASLAHARLADLRFAWWTIDTRDSWDRRSVDDVTAEIEQKGGGVVLMHDSGAIAGAESDHGEHVLELTRHILELAERRALRIVTMSQALASASSAGAR